MAGRLRARMAELGWSTHRLSRESSVDRAVILRIREGQLKRGPYLDTIERLAEALGVTAAWLGFGAGANKLQADHTS